MTLSTTLLCLLWSGVAALQVKIPKEVYESARGDNITLPCTFTTSQTNPKLIIIKWVAVGEPANDDETEVLTHYHPLGTTDVTHKYEGRASLDQNWDPLFKTGKANLKLSSITLDDNKNFECRLSIPGDDFGQTFKTTRLLVLVAPSTPICKIQGKAEYGQNISLTCVSEEGTPPPTYKWESHDVRNMPRVPDRRTTDKRGVLSLYNISKNTSGSYICTASNKIRSASCTMTLLVKPPPMSIDYTVPILVMRTAFVITPLIFIYCYYCRKKKQQEEYAMKAHEEVFMRTRSRMKRQDEETDRNGDSRLAGVHWRTGDEDSSLQSPSGQRHLYEEATEQSYVNSRDDGNQHSDYDDCYSGNNDLRGEDQCSKYNNQRSDISG